MFSKPIFFHSWDSSIFWCYCSSMPLTSFDQRIFLCLTSYVMQFENYSHVCIRQISFPFSKVHHKCTYSILSITSPHSSFTISSISMVMYLDTRSSSRYTLGMTNSLHCIACSVLESRSLTGSPVHTMLLPFHLHQ